MYFCYLRFLKLSKRVLPSRLNPRNARYFLTNLKADTVYLSRFRLHTFTARKNFFRFLQKYLVLPIRFYTLA